MKNLRITRTHYCSNDCNYHENFIYVARTVDTSARPGHGSVIISDLDTLKTIAREVLACEECAGDMQRVLCRWWRRYAQSV